MMTNWTVVTHTLADSNNVPHQVLEVDKSIISVWLKLASSWLVMALYAWTLVAPMILRGRDFS